MKNLHKPFPWFAVLNTCQKSLILCMKTKCHKLIPKVGSNWELGDDFVKICMVKKHMWEMEGSLSMCWVTCLVLG